MTDAEFVSGPASPSPTTDAQKPLKEAHLRASRATKAKPRRITRHSFPPDGLLSAGARRRRLLRGHAASAGKGDAGDDEWSSDSDSSSAHSRVSSVVRLVGNSDDSGSSGGDTIGAVVRRAKSTRLARGVGTLRVVSTPAAQRRRFPSVASALGLSPMRKLAPTPVSSPARGRFSSTSPFGGRTRLVSASSALSMTPATVASLGGPNFSPQAVSNVAADDGDSSFFSEQETISFIYEPAVISDMFSKGPAAAPDLPATPLSPFATPFVYKPPEPTPSRGKLSAEKARSYRALHLSYMAPEDEPFHTLTWGTAQIEETRRLQESGRGGDPIPVMVGPESLPYARNPSGVDGSVIDSNGRLNVWTRSPEDPEPEHVEFLHFQRRPGAPNPATRVLADDDLPNSAYSRPSDYAVPCAGPRPIFKPARPRQVVGLHPGVSPSVPFTSVLPSPGIPCLAPGLQFFPNTSLELPKPSPMPGWSDPLDAFAVLQADEDMALQILLDKLRASNCSQGNPFSAPPGFDGGLSPDFVLRTPGGSLFDSSPSTSSGLAASPYSSVPSHGTSPVVHLPQSVHLSNGVLPGAHAGSEQQQQAQHQMEDLLFFARLAGYGRPFHDPSFAPLTSPPTLPQAAPLQARKGPVTFVQPIASSQRTSNAEPSLMPSVDIAPRANTPHPSEPVPRQVGRRDSDLCSVGEEIPQLYPPNSTRPATPPSGTQSSLDRCDEAIFLPAGKGRGFANGGARRPGPYPSAAPRSLGRRALDSMEVAVGRERQNTVLEKERRAVLASRESNTTPVAVVVVGDLRKSAGGGRKVQQERHPDSRLYRRSGRASLPPSNSKAAGADKAVLTVGSLSAMFCDVGPPTLPKAAALRRGDQRRIVSEPARIRRSPAAKTTALRQRDQSGHPSSVGARASRQANQLGSATDKPAPAFSSRASRASAGAGVDGDGQTSKGGRSRGGRSRRTANTKKATSST